VVPPHALRFRATQSLELAEARELAKYFLRSGTAGPKEEGALDALRRDRRSGLRRDGVSWRPSEAAQRG
jgi:hypothetical protein